MVGVEERGLRAGGEGREDKRALCDSEDLTFILRATGIHCDFGDHQKAQLGLEPRRSPSLSALMTKSWVQGPVLLMSYRGTYTCYLHPLSLFLHL